MTRHVPNGSSPFAVRFAVVDFNLSVFCMCLLFALAHSSLLCSIFARCRLCMFLQFFMVIVLARSLLIVHAFAVLHGLHGNVPGAVRCKSALLSSVNARWCDLLGLLRCRTS